MKVKTQSNYQYLVRKRKQKTLFDFMKEKSSVIINKHNMKHGSSMLNKKSLRIIHLQSNPTSHILLSNMMMFWMITILQVLISQK